jgi:hypothetical protein
VASAHICGSTPYFMHFAAFRLASVNGVNMQSIGKIIQMSCALMLSHSIEIADSFLRVQNNKFLGTH